MLIPAYNQYCCTRTEERSEKTHASSINIPVNLQRFLVFSSHCHVFCCCCQLTFNPSSPPTPSSFLFSRLLSSVHHSLHTPHLCPAGSRCVVSRLTCTNVSVTWGPAACEDVDSRPPLGLTDRQKRGRH